MNASTKETTARNVVQASDKNSVIVRVAERYGVLASKLLETLQLTAFKQRDDRKVTDAQMMALLVVADQYKLNPFTKEIFAFEDKGAVVPVVSVDGWSRIINTHPDYDGIEFRYADEIVTMPNGKPCPAWAEAVIYIKGRGRPTVVREYLDEVYVGPRNGKNGPWQSHTKRMLRHKALIQGGRVALGFSGIYDEDEAHRIVETIVAEPTRAVATGNVEDLQDRLRQRTSAEPEIVDAEFTDPTDLAPAPTEDVPGDEASAPEGEELPPDLIEQRIGEAATDADLEALLPHIAAVKSYDPEANKDLTRRLLAKKLELLGGR